MNKPSVLPIIPSTSTGRGRFAPASAAHEPIAELPCVKALMAALHARDAALGEHCSDVGEVAFRLAVAAGLTFADCQITRVAGSLHDIGKIGLPDSILLGRAPLSVAERRTVEAHVEVGYQLLGAIPDLRKPAEIARCHHERWNGTGYPRRLKRLEIPVGARILAIADAFDAMTSGRRYQPRRTMNAAREVLLSDAGTHFDPDLVKIFISDVLIHCGAAEEST